MTGEWHIVPKRTRNNVPVASILESRPLLGACVHVGRQACPRADGTPCRPWGYHSSGAGWHPDLCPLQKSICQPSSPFSNSLLTASPLAAWYHIHNAVSSTNPKICMRSATCPNSWLVPPPPTILGLQLQRFHTHLQVTHGVALHGYGRHLKHVGDSERASPRRTRCSTREPIRERVPEVA